MERKRYRLNHGEPLGKSCCPKSCPTAYPTLARKGLYFCGAGAVARRFPCPVRLSPRFPLESMPELFGRPPIRFVPGHYRSLTKFEARLAMGSLHRLSRLLSWPSLSGTKRGATVDSFQMATQNAGSYFAGKRNGLWKNTKDTKDTSQINSNPKPTAHGLRPYARINCQRERWPNFSAGREALLLPACSIGASAHSEGSIVMPGSQRLLGCRTFVAAGAHGRFRAAGFNLR
jgi:hypothetical protein